MPVKSKAQLGYLATHQSKIGGHAAFLEWLGATPSVKSLPARVKKTKKKKGANG